MGLIDEFRKLTGKGKHTIWNGTDTVPQYGKILADCKGEFRYAYILTWRTAWTWKATVRRYHIQRWAYIDDIFRIP